MLSTAWHKRPLCCHALPRSYFAATLAAEISAAKAEGRYSEGVADLLGSDIAIKGQPRVRGGDAGRGQGGSVRVLIDPVGPAHGQRWSYQMTQLGQVCPSVHRTLCFNLGFRVQGRPSFHYSNCCFSCQPRSFPNSWYSRRNLLLPHNPAPSSTLVPSDRSCGLSRAPPPQPSAPRCTPC